MFRYVAFVWNVADPQARASTRVLVERLQAATSEWQTVIDSEGLTVLCRDVRASSSRPYRLQGDAGVVLGTLFTRGANGVPSASVPSLLDEDSTRAIVTTAGRALFADYWGRYVAFVHETAAHTVRILRDPTGGLPCFTVRLLGVDVFFSHMEEGALLGGRAFTINWKYVAAALCQNRLQVHATGLNEVTQVLGGECVAICRGQVSRQFYWNALEVAASPRFEDPTEAARLLREQTRDCVHAWTSGHQSIVHLLSGGLDSSIVLACLRDSPTSLRPQITCLNFYSPGSNTDERDYARLAAASAACEVVERPRISTLSLEPLLHVRTSCIPGDNYFYLDGGRVESEVAAERHATALFSGYGGDQIFFQARARYGAAEYLAQHGIGPALFSVALDAARVDRLSVWTVLREAFMHGLCGRRWSQRNELGVRRALIKPEVVRDISRDESLLHPWLHAPRGVSSAKIWHAYQLLFPYEFYHPLGADTDPEPVTPLLSQPLVELVLRIPTWLLTLGGWDRALARRAFQHDMPRQIVTRRTKGGREEHAKAILVRNLAFARDLLHDGGLVQAGILDKDRVVDVLSGKPTRTVSSNVELFACLSVEAWLRQWQAA
ncbi:MAG TPA: asparagine synthase C-terminal domain-containing protein [Steroidobacteraceae bacterium]|nr:asparagine synthase C-terminal domain-containing protein [Steroidobacteraceae bacterium]